jgi:hypothetical protein
MSVKQLYAVNPMKIYDLEKLNKHIEFWVDQEKQLEILVLAGVQYSDKICTHDFQCQETVLEKYKEVKRHVKHLYKREITLLERRGEKNAEQDAIRFKETCKNMIPWVDPDYKLPSIYDTTELPEMPSVQS